MTCACDNEALLGTFYGKNSLWLVLGSNSSFRELREAKFLSESLFKLNNMYFLLIIIQTQKSFDYFWNCNNISNIQKIKVDVMMFKMSCHKTANWDRMLRNPVSNQ